eukprot:Platyproteum_vivax@DN6794_c0_g1_i1.p1
MARANSPAPQMLHNPQARIYMQNPRIAFPQQVQQASGSLVPLNHANTPRMSNGNMIRSSTPLPLPPSQPAAASQPVANRGPQMSSPMNYNLMSAENGDWRRPSLPVNMMYNLKNGMPHTQMGHIPGPGHRFSLDPSVEKHVSNAEAVSAVDASKTKSTTPRMSVDEQGLQETKMMPINLIPADTHRSAPDSAPEETKQSDLIKTETHYSKRDVEVSANETDCSKVQASDIEKYQEEIVSLTKEKQQLEKILIVKESVIHNLSENTDAVPEVMAMQLGAQAIQIAHEAMQSRKSIQKIETELQSWKHDANLLAETNQFLEALVDQQKKSLLEQNDNLTKKDRNLIDTEGKYKKALQEVHGSESLLRQQLNELARASAELETEAALQSAQMEQLRREVASRDAKIVGLQEETVRMQTVISELTNLKVNLQAENQEAQHALHQMIEQAALKDNLVEEYEGKLKTTNYELQKSLTNEVRRQKLLSMELQLRDQKMEEAVITRDKQIEALNAQLHSTSKTVDLVKTALSNTKESNNNDSANARRTPPPPDLNTSSEFSPILFRGAIPNSFLTASTNYTPMSRFLEANKDKDVKDLLEVVNMPPKMTQAFLNNKPMSHHPSLAVMPVAQQTSMRACESTSTLYKKVTPTTSGVAFKSIPIAEEKANLKNAMHVVSLGDDERLGDILNLPVVTKDANGGLKIVSGQEHKSSLVSESKESKELLL